MTNTVALRSSYARAYPSEISFHSLARSQSRFPPGLQFGPQPSSHGWHVSKIVTRGTTSCAAREGALR
jgi:hypothetical protein